MGALAGYDAKLVVNGAEIYYSDISPTDKADSIDVSRTGPKGRRKSRMTGQRMADISCSLVWSTDQNPNNDPPNLVAGAVLENVHWYPDRDEPGYWSCSRVNVVSVAYKGPVADAIRYDVTLESGEDADWDWVS